MDTISRLPLHRWVVPGIHDKYLTRFRQIESNTASFQRDQKDCDLRIFREPLDGRRTRSGCHVSIQLNTVEARATNSPLNKIKEARELREHNGLSSDGSQEFHYLDRAITRS